MASTGSTPTYTNIDVSKWTFSEVKRTPTGAGSIRIKQSASNSVAPLFILGRMRAPFGISEPYCADESKLQQQDTESGRRNLNLSVDNPNIREWLSNLDDTIISWVIENSTSVFGRVLKRSSVEDVIYFRALHASKNPDYAPTFRVKVNIAGSNPTKILINIPGTTQFFLGNKEDLTRGSEVIPTVLAYSMWVTNSQIGITFIATHLLVFQASTGPANPYEGYTEAPRPALTSSSASAAGSTSAASASDDKKFTYDDDPSDMF
jgi:hypothetical protein